MARSHGSARDAGLAPSRCNRGNGSGPTRGRNSLYEAGQMIQPRPCCRQHTHVIPFGDLAIEKIIANCGTRAFDALRSQKSRKAVGQRPTPRRSRNRIVPRRSHRQ